MKLIKDFKAGDVIHFSGGTFRVLADASPCYGHGPRYRLTELQGPTDCARVDAVCLTGEVEGYFKPGSPWTFQGTSSAGRYRTA